MGSARAVNTQDCLFPRPFQHLVIATMHSTCSQVYVMFFVQRNTYYLFASTLDDCHCAFYLLTDLRDVLCSGYYLLTCRFHT